MKIIKSTPRPNGVTRLIIELAPGEAMRVARPGRQLVEIDPDAHYRLGQPLQDDVMAGHILADATRVHWCSVEQKWRDE